MDGTENNNKIEEQAGNNSNTQNNSGAQNNNATQNSTGVQKNEAKFTQAEFEKALKDEVARKTRGIPSKEELKAFEAWKEAQKTAEDKQKEDAVKMQNLQVENDSKTQIIDIMKKGVDYDTAEFIQFKLSKMEGDFSDNLENYFNNNPVTSKKEEKKVETTGFSQNNTSNGNGETEEKAYLDKKYANNPYYKK